MSILKKLKSLAPALSAVVVAACIGVSLHGYSTPVYAVDIPETTKNQTDEDASEQENADTAEKEKKEDKKKDEDKKEEQKSTAKGSFDVSDGTYYGTGTGFAGKIKVAVTVKDKQITAIEIVENEADDDAFFSRAKGVIDKIISGQTLEVDVVSGATYSSNGIISAVKNALTGQQTAEHRHQHQQVLQVEVLHRQVVLLLSQRYRMHLPTQMEHIMEQERDFQEHLR